MTCGEKISDLRKKRGMTQDDLGKAMNVSYQAVSKWERGESQPDFETMSKIAKLFGVPIGYFEEGGELLLEEQPPVETKQEEIAEEQAEETPSEEKEVPPKTQEETEEPKQEVPPVEAAAVLEELAEETKEPAKEEASGKPPAIPIGVCTVCGKMLKEGDEETTTPKLVCKACAERQRKAAQQRAEQQKEETRRVKEAEVREVVGHGFDFSLIIALLFAVVGYILFAILSFKHIEEDESFVYGIFLYLIPLALFGIVLSIARKIKEWKNVTDETEYNLVTSLIVGGVFAVINFALFLPLYLSVGNDEGGYFVGLMILAPITSFTFVSQYLWGSVVKEIFTAGGFTFKLPGFIITLDIDSILWMIVTKFFLGLLAVLVFVVTTAFVALVAFFGSVFLFVPCLLWKIGKDRKARKRLKE